MLESQVKDEMGQGQRTWGRMIPPVITVVHTLRKGVFALSTALPSTGKEVWLPEKKHFFQGTSKIPTELQTDVWTFWAPWTNKPAGRTKSQHLIPAISLDDENKEGSTLVALQAHSLSSLTQVRLKIDMKSNPLLERTWFSSHSSRTLVLI